MPELAEVEYYRKRWAPGLNQKVLRVEIHAAKRLFRGTDTALLQKTLPGAILRESETRGKQMVFRFSKGIWLGVHLGMTGELRTEEPAFTAGKHDHLVLCQQQQALVFSDARMFGRVLFHCGAEPPEWWTALPPAISSDAWSLEHLRAAIGKRRVPLKALLLSQELFPGIGNWMADEILWRARLHPRMAAPELTSRQLRTLWTETREVVEIALRTIAVNFGDPPAGWLFHVRWTKGGLCPKHHTPLDRATIGGRTTAWCPRCQPQKQETEGR